MFEVTGTGKAFNITATVGASVQNESGVALPWTRTVEVHGKYTIDGTTVREGRASGPYGVLTITDS